MKDVGTGGKRSDERKRRPEESYGWHVTEYSNEEKFSECGSLNVIHVSYNSKFPLIRIRLCFLTHFD